MLTETVGNMATYRGYYDSLKGSFNGFQTEVERLIWLDIERTNHKLTNDQKTILHRVLFCFTKRNMEISYCQGMNFIVFYFHNLGFVEEEIFWIFCYLMEQSVPLSYYINLIPVYVDIEIFMAMLRIKLPNLAKFIETNLFDLNFVMIPLLVTLLTTAKNPKVS